MQSHIRFRFGPALALVTWMCTLAVGDGSVLQSGTAPTAGKESPSTEADVTVVGCLVRTEKSGGKPGSSATGPGERSESSVGLVLKEAVVWTDEAPPKGPMTTRSDREFGLRNPRNGDVKVHAGHQVEVKGRLRRTVDVAPNGKIEQSPPPAAGGHVIEIASVRSLSDNCPPQR
jgi:hypothetical protein